MQVKASQNAHIFVRGDSEAQGLHDGQFIAYASTWTRTPDCYGDVVKKGAFADTLKEWEAKGMPIPILYGHDEQDPYKNIGYVVKAEEDDHGLRITGQLDIVDNPQAEQVYRLLKGHRLNQMSFGYTVQDQQDVQTPNGYANELRAVKLYEVSIVPRGANADTSIEQVKGANTPEAPDTSDKGNDEAEHLYKLYLANMERAVAAGLAMAEKTATTRKRDIEEWVQRFEEHKRDIRRKKMTHSGTNLHDELHELRSKAAFIEERAKIENRPLTDDEEGEVFRLHEEAEHQELTIKKLEENTRKLNELSTGEHTEPNDEGDFMEDWTPKRKEGRLDLRSIAKTAPKAMLASSRARGVKSGLDLSGGVLFDVPVVNPLNPINDEHAEIPPSLLDYLKTQVTAVPTYDVLVEKTPDNAGGAAVVPAGGEKPTYKLGIVHEQHTLKVIAVMSDPIDEYMIRDSQRGTTGSISDWIGQKLALEVWRTLETEILTGTGGDKHLNGLASIKGTKTQTAQANVFDTIAGGLSAISSQGLNVDCIALSPADWLTICTSKDANSRYMNNNVVDAAAQRLFDVQVAIAAGLPKGTGWVIGTNALAVATDGKTMITWNNGGDLFSHNQVVFRAEGRYSLDVFKPHALCKLSLPTTTATPPVTE